jgi:hypothetical protein
VISRTESERVDTKAVRELLGDQVSKVIKKSEVVTVRVVKREAPEPA